MVMISTYTEKSIQNPCEVAMNSKHNLRALLLQHKEQYMDNRVKEYQRRNAGDKYNIFQSALDKYHMHNEHKSGQPQQQKEQQQHQLKELLQLLAQPLDESPSIPKIIHQQWKDENIPIQFQKWRNKWLQYYPSPQCTHLLWTDESSRTFLLEHYSWFVPVYDTYCK